MDRDELSAEEPLSLPDDLQCWCGQAVGHWWRGKASGVPHPKQMSEAFYAARPKGSSSKLWTGDAATYSARHKRVVQARGLAKDQECLNCGARARDWAQVHGTDGLDAKDYNPLCRKCHIKYDESHPNAKKTHCNKGHPLVGDNLRIEPDGRRRCRECANAASRRYYAKRGAERV
jgi:hypothetical protein